MEALQLGDETGRHCPVLEEKTKATGLVAQCAIQITLNDVVCSAADDKGEASAGGARKVSQ
jgi:hypothetical protein